MITAGSIEFANRKTHITVHTYYLLFFSNFFYKIMKYTLAKISGIF